MSDSRCPICEKGESTYMNGSQSVGHNRGEGYIPYCYSVCDYCGVDSVNNEDLKLNKAEVTKLKKGT